MVKIARRPRGSRSVTALSVGLLLVNSLVAPAATTAAATTPSAPTPREIEFRTEFGLATDPTVVSRAETQAISPNWGSG